jgi:hypothetical protein
LTDSDRLNVITFDRHFSREERDLGLKELFREPESMSGILNWLLDGYKHLSEEGLDIPEKAKLAIQNFRNTSATKEEKKAMEIVAALRQFLKDNLDKFWVYGGLRSQYYKEDRLGVISGDVLYVRGSDIPHWEFSGTGGAKVKKILIDEGYIIVGEHDCEAPLEPRGFTHKGTAMPLNNLTYYAFDIKKLMGDDEAI